MPAAKSQWSSQFSMLSRRERQDWQSKSKLLAEKFFCGLWRVGSANFAYYKLALQARSLQPKNARNHSYVIINSKNE
jgi:hypothetical protein